MFNANVTDNVSLLLHDLCEIRSEIKVKDSTFWSISKVLEFVVTDVIRPITDRDLADRMRHVPLSLYIRIFLSIFMAALRESGPS